MSAMKLAQRPSVIIISGPTASGKSDLAIQLARRIGGEIVNCDSVQVYRYCDIGSAKPDQDERTSVPHHLFDIFEPNQQCDASRYRTLALGAIDEIQGRGKIPVLVGSSGLYISTLLEGIDPMPPSSEEVRAALNCRTTESLYEELSLVDAERANVLHPADRGRIIRALEVWKLSGVPQSKWFESSDLSGKSTSELSAIILVVLPTRDVLYQRINQRSRRMVLDGLIDETRGIIAAYGATVAPLFAIGYRETREFLARGAPDQEREALIERIAMVTRRYSKRQRTYWRNEPAKRGWEPFLTLFNGKEAVLEDPWLNILSRQCAGVGNQVKVWYLYGSLLEYLESEHG